MALAQSFWAADASDAPVKTPVEPSFPVREKLEAVLEEARKSQRKERSLGATLRDAEEREPSLRALTSATAEEIDAWLAELKQRRRDDDATKPYCNKKQFKAIKLVAKRVQHELRFTEGETSEGFGEPLRWLFHGGPGTGKSEAVRIIKKELFEGLLKWDMGVEFQTVALQAVMAEQLGGDTIHHACGIPVFNGRECHGDDVQTHLKVAKRVLQWRWLIIDEISMVSAKLLAEVDVKLRSVVREIGTAKRGRDGIDRPFGGLNVIFCGDFWQLAPPDGGFLASIPTEYIQDARKYRATPTVAHGQSLLWSGVATGIAGVTEFNECERCDDVWMREVQEEMRHGRLSEDNYSFLHGFPTAVPGSWEVGDVKCGREACRALALRSQGASSVGHIDKDALVRSTSLTFGDFWSFSK